MPSNSEKVLFNGNDDEFPPDDIVEDDLIETKAVDRVSERDIMVQKEVNTDLSFKLPSPLTVDQTGFAKSNLELLHAVTLLLPTFTAIYISTKSVT